MIKTSETINELAEALSKAQGPIENVKRDQTAERYKYANLAQVLDMSRPLLADNDLSIVQFPGTAENGDMELTTRVMHKSGQWIESTFDMPIVIPMSKAGNEMMSAPQAAGSTLSYMRRYAMSSVLGIAQEDNDAAPGEHGSKTYRKEPSDDKPWYNSVEQDKEAIMGAMIGGKTAKIVIAELRERYKVNKKAVDAIEGYEQDARTTG